MSDNDMRFDVEHGTMIGAQFQAHIAFRRLWITLLRFHPMIALPRILSSRILDEATTLYGRKRGKDGER